MKKLLVLLCCTAIFISGKAISTAFSENSSNCAVQEATPLRRINNDSPFTATGTVIRNGKTGAAYSKTRVTGDSSKIRDVDYIYVRVRGYYDTSLVFSEEKSENDASDVSVSKTSTIKLTICYGTHKYKEEGYLDIFQETWQ